MAGAGVTQSVCLPLLSVYQLSTNGAIQVGAASFWVGMHQESLPCPALWAMAGVESSQFGRTAATPTHWRLPKWWGGFVMCATLDSSVNKSFIFVSDLFRHLLHLESLWMPPLGLGSIVSPCH